VARFGEVACLGDLPGLCELLKTSDSQPASLAPIGRSTNAATAATIVRRGQKQKRMNFLTTSIPASPE
jgi:hypothetical protein